MRRQPLTAWTVLAIAATVIVALALSAIPLGVGPDTTPWPNFTLCVVFFWIIHRPVGLPLLGVLAIGLIHDLIGGGVIGAGMMALVVASLFLRPAAKPLDLSAFGLRWLAFAGFTVAVFAIEWALIGVSRWSWPPLGAPLAQVLVTVLAYLPVSVLFRRVFRIGRT